jgi:hypothetical protein
LETIMRVGVTLLILTALGAAGWVALVRPAARGMAAARQEELPPPRPALVVGVASCAAAACHNANGPPGHKGSEYSTWAACDPHARAYEVLFDERSRRMVLLFKGLKSQADAHPEHEPLCRSCHVYPAPHLAAVKHDCRFSPDDGVGCEACHGPAEKWRGLHYTEEWKRLSDSKKHELGFTLTRDLHVRAEVCARCHVGEKDMDVNHDLIAAGHPRLRFELGAYLANYPKHWNVEAEKKGKPDHEARVWILGQLVSAKAALELLRYRAENAGANKKPWPEFAEYNCAACHHELKEPSGRRERGFGPRAAGQLPWGTWYYPLLPTLARSAPGGGTAGRDLLAGLDKLMRARVPNEDAVARQAGEAAARVNDWLDAVEKAPSGPRVLLPALARAERRPATWDEATQLYLGLAALQHALSDMEPSHRKQQAGLAEAVRAVGCELEKAFPRGRRSIYDTPDDFDAGRLEERLRAVRERLR